MKGGAQGSGGCGAAFQGELFSNMQLGAACRPRLIKSPERWELGALFERLWQCFPEARLRFDGSDFGSHPLPECDVLCRDASGNSRTDSLE